MKKKKIIRINQEVLAERQPIITDISGNINSVTNWLNKRTITLIDPEEITEVDFEDEEQETGIVAGDMAFVLNELQGITPMGMVKQKESHILVDREKMTITLVLNENDPFTKGKVVGSLAFHPDFVKWRINTGDSMGNKNMSEFVKMNRSSFVDKNDAMKLSGELQNLKVKVDREVENSDDNRANIRSMLSQKVIDVNIPKTFMLHVPIFKGGKKVSFEVEIYVNPSSFDISLVSPDANDEVARVKDGVIDAQIVDIRTIAPDLVIIEQ